MGSILGVLFLRETTTSAKLKHAVYHALATPDVQDVTTLKPRLLLCSFVLLLPNVAII